MRKKYMLLARIENEVSRWAAGFTFWWPRHVSSKEDDLRKGTSFMFWTVEYMILKVKGFGSIQNTQTTGLIVYF